MERLLEGMSASPGIVVGPVHLLIWEVPEVPHHIITDDEIPEELDRLREARERAKDRLRRIRERVERRAGPKEAEIFDVQLQMLDDIEMLREVEDLIQRNLGADYAVDTVLLEWRRKFARAKAPMVRERVADLTDVHIRLLTILMGLPDHDPVDVPKGTNAVLVTHDLTPSLTVQLDREAIAGVATDAGTRTSHVAILARSLGLPAVVGLRNATAQLRGGERVILDGSRGWLVVHPSDAEVERYERRAAEQEAEAEEERRTVAPLEAITADGVPIVLRTNVDIPEEAEVAARSGADGVGLMRTEFLVVGRATMPDEEEQYQAYRRVAEAFGGRTVVIRTFDLGGDKLPVGGHPSEPNPFLGWRAIRMCLDQPELFKTQLRGLLRAAVHGDVHIMLPLIVSVEEVREAKRLLAEAAEELRARGVPHRPETPLGVMIETPAAAMTADALVGEASFFSIGTNDLVQYTLAVDRGNANLASRFTPFHPAVLRLIRRTVEVANANAIPVAVCGEMASQPLMALALLGLGLRQLSVNPRAVVPIKRVIRSVTISAASEIIEGLLAAPSAAAAEAELVHRFRDVLGDQPFLQPLPHDPPEPII